MGINSRKVERSGIELTGKKKSLWRLGGVLEFPSIFISDVVIVFPVFNFLRFNKRIQANFLVNFPDFLSIT